MEDKRIYRGFTIDLEDGVLTADDGLDFFMSENMADLIIAIDEKIYEREETKAIEESLKRDMLDDMGGL